MSAVSAPAALLVVGAVLLRLAVGLLPYSGANHPPKYGDYEAQRHWMELTVNLPTSAWYADGPDNDPKYWPLDYPPLSGWQSYAHGLLVRRFDPAAVALRTSRGYETPWSKLLLRWTVLLSDLLVYFPAAFAAARVFAGVGGSPDDAGAAAAARRQRRELFVLAAMLLQPALLLADHAHFQYNCISLGLAAGAAAATGAGRAELGAVLFSLSLCHKQMSLFLAPAFFAHMLGRCLQASPTLAGKALKVLRLGLAVAATFAVVWSPWLGSGAALAGVLRRIFPVRRGLYEDYLSNWWCATSAAVKWKALVPPGALVPLCAGLTLLAAAPAMAREVWRPSRRGLLLCMANSAAAFFMFGYQVHEKSILLPLLPVTMLAAAEPDAALWGPLAGCFQMFSLLQRDGAAPAYAALLPLYVLLLSGLPPASTGGAATLARPWARLAAAAAVAGGVALHALRALVPPPARLPWLHDRLFASYGFALLAPAVVYLNWVHWQTRPDEEDVEEEEGGVKQRAAAAAAVGGAKKRA